MKNNGMPDNKMGRFRYQVASVQGVGDRDSQQDSFGTDITDSKSILAVVADGMGGLVNSDQVSKAIVSAMLDAYAPGPEQPALHQLLLLLKRAIAESDRVTGTTKYDSGSTVVACIANGKGLSFISVGDSRICLWRNGGMVQLNRDHDLSHELYMMTLNDGCTVQEVEANPRREALTSFIGRDFPRYVDFNTVPITVQKGDKLILMSDGVYRALTEKELCKPLKKSAKAASVAIDKLICRKAIRHQDNYTAIVIEIR